VQHMFEKQVFVCMCEHSLEEGRWQHTPIQTHKYTQGECVAVCCSVLQCVAVCCSVLQCVATESSGAACTRSVHYNEMQYVAV